MEIEKSEVKVESFVRRGWLGGRKLKLLRMSSLSSSVLNEKWAANLRKISIWEELSLESNIWSKKLQEHDRIMRRLYQLFYYFNCIFLK